MKKDNIILIGFMGAGKSSVSETFAAQYNHPVLDTDLLIEAQEGMTIPELFEQKGEEYFRLRETELLKELLDSCQKTVISVGGGLPIKEENRQLLKLLGQVIYLQADTETILSRLKDDHNRPLLQGDELEVRISRLLAEREHYYSQVSDYIVDTSGKTLAEIAAEIDRMVEK